MGVHKGLAFIFFFLRLVLLFFFCVVPRDERKRFSIYEIAREGEGVELPFSRHFLFAPRLRGAFVEIEAVRANVILMPLPPVSCLLFLFSILFLAQWIFADPF